MTEPRRKKRVRPARKIIARGQMGIQWVVGAVGLAVVILVLGIVFLLSN
jgi:hypothetical protein